MDFAKDQSYKRTRIWAWARSSWIGESLRTSRRYRSEFGSWTRRTWGESVKACKRCGASLGLDTQRAGDSSTS